MTQAYEVRQIPVWPEVEHIRVESRGTRRKFWISIEDEPNLWLLKFPRPNTGEHWAEKVAYEIGNLIGVNCARVELADYDDELVTICESFIPPENLISAGGELHFFPGLEVLWIGIEGYDTSLRFGQRGHNIKNIARSVTWIARNAQPDHRNQLLEDLASYALLDGLIGNTDRHHENWMLSWFIHDARSPDDRFEMMPSYDHASSLGRELSDEARQRILDNANVLRYLQRGRGGVYLDGSQKHGPSPLALAMSLCQRWPKYTRRTLARIDAVRNDEFRTIVDKVPVEFMSSTAKDFAYEVLVASKTELLENAP